MDISKITDINELKALGFDTIGRLEAEQRNLQLIQGRIQELTANPPQETEDSDV